MGKKSISIIIAAYNAEKYINQCIDSFLAQTFPDWELIAVDDGSEDRTAEILDEYARKDSRIRVIRNEHAGAAHARNTGMAEAKGDYFLFFDADDFVDPDLLQVMYDDCTQHGAEICVVGSRSLDMAAGTTNEMPYTIKQDLLPSDNPFQPLKDMPDQILVVFNGWAWDKLIARKVLERWDDEILLPFQEIRTSNDMAFVDTALVLADRIYVDPGVHITHRDKVKGSLSNSREESWNCFYLALKELRERLIRLGLYKEVEASYVQWAADFVEWNLNSLNGMAFAKAYELMHTEGIQTLGIPDAPETYYQGHYADARKFCEEVLQRDVGESFRYLKREEYDLRGTRQERDQANQERDRITAERDQAYHEKDEVIQERDQLHAENSRLQEVEKELESANAHVTEERDKAMEDCQRMGTVNIDLDQKNLQLQNENEQLREAQKNWERERDIIFHSITWKVGRLLLFIPIHIADAIRNRRKRRSSGLKEDPDSSMMG